jgi:ABC-type transporter Mla MlaB component
MSSPPPPPPPGAILVDLDGPVARGDALALCRQLERRLAKQRTGGVICDVATLSQPDLATLDALARMQLTARRCGARLQLQGATPGLIGLLALTGLAEALPLLRSIEPHRQPEQREQRLHVEEGIDPGDAAV